VEARVQGRESKTPIVPVLPLTRAWWDRAWQIVDIKKYLKRILEEDRREKTAREYAHYKEVADKYEKLIPFEEILKVRRPRRLRHRFLAVVTTHRAFSLGARPGLQGRI
jgi:hypothetical protein